MLSLPDALLRHNFIHSASPPSARFLSRRFPGTRCKAQRGTILRQYLTQYFFWLPQVAVAVMQWMAVPAGEDPAEAARLFAKALHNEWGVGDAACNNGVLLLLSIDDRQVRRH